MPASQWLQANRQLPWQCVRQGGICCLYPGTLWQQMPCFSDAHSKQLGQHAVGSEVSLGNTRASLQTALLLTFVCVIDKWKPPALGQPLSHQFRFHRAPRILLRNLYPYSRALFLESMT